MEKTIEAITLEDIRLIPDYRNFTDVQLQEIVDSIKEFALILSLKANDGRLATSKNF